MIRGRLTPVDQKEGCYKIHDYELFNPIPHKRALQCNFIQSYNFSPYIPQSFVVSLEYSSDDRSRPWPLLFVDSSLGSVEQVIFLGVYSRRPRWRERRISPSWRGWSVSLSAFPRNPVVRICLPSGSLVFSSVFQYDRIQHSDTIFNIEFSNQVRYSCAALYSDLHLLHSAIRFRSPSGSSQVGSAI